MPSPKSHRRSGGEEKNRKGRLPERSSSFHGQHSENVVDMLRRPRTVPDLLAGVSGGKALVQNSIIQENSRPKLTKLLLNVTIQRSLGAVQVLISPESTVEELIAAAVRQYAKEGRRPVLPSTDPSCFDLHYSQFSLESLDREEKVITLGSRNFFMCPKKIVDVEKLTTASSCCKQAEKATKTGSSWLKFMDFLL